VDGSLAICEIELFGKKASDYSVLAENTQCEPDSFIHNWEFCKQAAISLGYQMSPQKFIYNWFQPRGCFLYPQFNELAFNHHPVGRGHSQIQPVCHAQEVKEWSAPLQKIWSDGQCKNVGNVADCPTMRDCQSKCEMIPSCNAVNYTPLSKAGALRSCPLPIPKPDWSLKDYIGSHMIGIVFSLWSLLTLP
jgi:hypothetical protein